MAMNRRTLLAAAAASAVTSALTACTAEQGANGEGVTTVTAATLERSQGTGASFVPLGEFRPLAAGYVEEEWFASGTDDNGQAYKTHIVVRRPSDPARFSGVVLVEPLHASAAAPVHSYSSPYITRAGHGYACVASQKGPLDARLKPANAERYASLHIETSEPAPDPAAPPPTTPEEQEARREAMGRFNQASNAILAQTGAALRAPGGPFGEVRHVILIGHSQTGGVVTNFINNKHASNRLDGGAAIYDGYFPSGAARDAFAPRDSALVQVLSEGDIDDPTRSNGRAYRRDDSDEAGDRYRLYELAGAAHMGTRYPPHNDPGPWIERTQGAIKAGDKMTSYPHNEMFNVGLSHLVKWVVDGTAPPRADRIETDANGAFVKDEHGNSRGGVRCAQVDVPHATYHPDPVGAQAVVGTETQFPAAKMRQLYQTPANYAQRFNARLDELIAQGWFLAEDADDMRAEAQAQRF